MDVAFTVTLWMMLLVVCLYMLIFYFLATSDLNTCVASSLC